MALFGDFKDFLFEDIVTMAAEKSGRLRITSVPGFDALELDLSDGQIRDFTLNDTEHLDVSYLQTAFKNSISSREGSFEFFNLDPSIFHNRLNVSVIGFMLSSARALDEIEESYEMLPSPETRFIMNEPALQGISIADDDTAYIELTHEDLRSGASAEYLNTKHGIPTIYFRYYLHRWSLLDLIRPLRLQHRMSINPPTPGAVHSTSLASANRTNAVATSNASANQATHSSGLLDVNFDDILQELSLGS
jgi:hypothetical protein